MLSKTFAYVSVVAMAYATDPIVVHTRTWMCPMGAETIYPAGCPAIVVPFKHCPTTKCPHSDEPRDPHTCRCKCDKHPEDPQANCHESQARMDDCSCKSKAEVKLCPTFKDSEKQCGDKTAWFDGTCKCEAKCEEGACKNERMVRDPTDCSKCICLYNPANMACSNDDVFDWQSCDCLTPCTSGWPRGKDGKCPEEHCTQDQKDALAMCTPMAIADWGKCQCTQDLDFAQACSITNPKKCAMGQTFENKKCECGQMGTCDDNKDPCTDPQKKWIVMGCQCVCEQEKEGIPACGDGKVFDRDNCECKAAKAPPCEDNKCCQERADDPTNWPEHAGLRYYGPNAGHSVNNCSK